MIEESFQQEIELYTISVSFEAKENQTKEARPSKKNPHLISIRSYSKSHLKDLVIHVDEIKKDEMNLTRISKKKHA